MFSILGSVGASAGDFSIGAASEDITGPAAELGMMGYAELPQTTRGIHSRLYARAFVIEDLISHRRVAYVNADLAFIAQAVKLAVVDELQRQLPGVYGNDNVLLTATHTHSGPGGYSSFALYNITILGFDAQNFNVIVRGITRSILTAHSRRSPGSIYFGEGRLENATVNRSMSAYLANPEASQYSDTTNKTMSVLKLVEDTGREIGTINWFSIHSTSLSKHNHLISSDSKGDAAARFEMLKPGFVAAFSNSDEGDVSPNIYDKNWGRAVEDFQGLAMIGGLQFSKALEVYNQANNRLSSLLDYRHLWVKMPGYTVGAQYTGNSPQYLCNGGIGYAFAAGAEDGRADTAGMREGLKQGDVLPTSSFLNWLYTLGRYALLGVTPSDERCQFPKPILIDTGRQLPTWTPDVLPFQLVRIGSIALAAVPAELTTMAGRLLRQTIAEHLAGSGVERVIIVGLANTYSDYVTTKPEYDQQQYEGASTLFGPYTFAAYRQIFAQLGDSLRSGGRGPASVGPAPSGRPQITLQTGVVFDDKRLREKFGQVMRQPRAYYRRGEQVSVSFRTGHPKNDLRTGASYLEVQKRVGAVWQTVARDTDPETFYAWRRDKAWDCASCSFADISWVIPEYADAGDYRIAHSGAAKNGWSGRISGFWGASRTFSVY